MLSQKTHTYVFRIIVAINTWLHNGWTALSYQNSLKDAIDTTAIAVTECSGIVPSTETTTSSKQIIVELHVLTINHPICYANPFVNQESHQLQSLLQTVHCTRLFYTPAPTMIQIALVSLVQLLLPPNWVRYICVVANTTQTLFQLTVTIPEYASACTAMKPTPATIAITCFVHMMKLWDLPCRLF